jgi:outer membrane protein G
MKKIFTIVLLGAFFTMSAQVFKGKGDTKFNLGMTIQDGGTGIVASTDFGLGENISVGVLSSYLLGYSDYLERKTTFEDRFDAKVRFNANLGNIINIENLDLYPGLNLGLKNFGGHIGARYFFSEGFGIFSEFSFPIAKYDKNAIAMYNNGVTFNIGAAFSFK